MTARTPYFRIAPSVVSEFRSDHELATFVRLLAHWSDRWARERWTAERAKTLDLGERDLLALTGKRQVPAALRVLEKVTRKLTDSRLEVFGFQHASWSGSRLESVRLFWPKLPDFQGWTDRDRDRGRARRQAESAEAEASASPEREEATHPGASSESGEAPSPHSPRETQAGKPKANGKARAEKRRPPRTPAPERLSPADYEIVRSWAEDVFPAALDDLERRVEEVLEFYRARGDRFVDWSAAVVNNLRTRENARREREGESLLRSRREARRLRRLLEKKRAEAAGAQEESLFGPR